jgi:hypothetical protein
VSSTAIEWRKRVDTIDRMVGQRTEGMAEMPYVPVPKRFLPLIYGTLADAYRSDAAEKSQGVDTPQDAPMVEDPLVWTKEEVVRAYREATPSQRAVFDYLAAEERAGHDVPALELAHVVYPGLSEEEAWGKLNGTLGGFGTKVAQKYHKLEWFFSATRPDPRSYIVYKMQPKVAA